MRAEDIQNTKKIRKSIFLTAYSYSKGASHLASSFSIVEILYTLYMKNVLRYRAGEPLWPGRDFFILSKGHAGLALYSTLCMAGFFEEAELMRYCKPGSKIGSEPKLHDLPGIEATTGSLGHGLSFGCGIALAKKMAGADANVYVLIGDGESQEGSIWEAAMSAARHKLDNLTVILDQNRLQKMDTIENIMGIKDWASIWRSFGWQVTTVDGHDTEALHAAFTAPPNGSPRLVVAETVKGKGVSLMEHNVDWHYKMPLKRELKQVLQELEIDEMELEKCRELT